MRNPAIKRAIKPYILNDSNQEVNPYRSVALINTLTVDGSIRFSLDVSYIGCCTVQFVTSSLVSFECFDLSSHLLHHYRNENLFCTRTTEYLCTKEIWQTSIQFL